MQNMGTEGFLYSNIPEFHCTISSDSLWILVLLLPLLFVYLQSFLQAHSYHPVTSFFGVNGLFVLWPAGWYFFPRQFLQGFSGFGSSSALSCIQELPTAALFSPREVGRTLKAVFNSSLVLPDSKIPEQCMCIYVCFSFFIVVVTPFPSLTMSRKTLESAFALRKILILSL